MGEVIKFDQWKKDNPRNVKRVEKIRAHSRNKTGAETLHELPDAREEVDKIAQRILAHDGVMQNPIWKRRDVNPELWRTQYMSRTTTELAEILQHPRVLGKSEKEEEAEWIANPIHFGIAAELYRDKIKRERDEETVRGNQ
ncbi:hypothetical protein A2673_00725 [Candidatus Kaiserbacteria bacterium RIFCSPHIGHO2_01_FULL_50_13]|uniref:Uncharacterized protein n=1 Tax=Candidatus Kaiserbacteria bacterium RIFCSPLOWO2_01_FULL_50_24 TaxID=1798507 RepID=A0A1F6EMX5_9BACT|nr:MAG: hypothetical protein A2673_00725 [Candidatus Kaiserbacteria bacterium RIFCSPHIGHO2_01_FULL_50_13]OGG74996.1 MAG: hypothetical protein A3A34_04240 [Candidatus Kaiserbacteria bacterium RIFCSPLOWO2_01_FULL_50_24]